MIGGVVCAEAMGVLPPQPWHGPVAGVVALSAITLAVHPSLRLLHKLVHPRHMEEFAEALELVSNLSAEEAHRSSLRPRTIHLASTRMGIQISRGQFMEGTTLVWHYTLSQAGEAMTVCTARFLARLVAPLTRSPQPAKVVAGRMGTFHLLMAYGEPNVRR